MPLALSLALQSLILTFGVCVVLFWLWPSVRLDCYRQSMFEIRDELFDYAASGKIAFTHPAYQLLRQMMNGFIRYGHQLSFYQFVMTWAEWKLLEGRESFKWEKKWNTAIQSLDETTREDMLAFYGRSMLCVSKRIVLGSPFLMLSLGISVIAVLFHMGWKSARGIMTAAFSQTVARSLDRRILEEEAARAA